jgi:hypothetical protein
MARTKSNSMSDLIAVAELKDLLLSIDAKLDLLLNDKITPTTTVTHCSGSSDAQQATPQDLGPDSWEEDKLNEWVNDLDGMTRYCVENGGMTAQEVWESMKAEGWLK